MPHFFTSCVQDFGRICCLHLQDLCPLHTKQRHKNSSNFL